MKLKNIATALAALLLTFAVVDLCFVGGKHVMAEDDQRLFIPNVGDGATAGFVSWTEHQRREGVSGLVQTSRNDGKIASRNPAAGRRPVASQLAADAISPEGRASPTAKLMRQILPWFAGALGASGLLMALGGIFSRRRPQSGYAARSAAGLHSGEVGWINRNSTSQPVLALRLVHADPPNPRTFGVHQEPEREERELRRAA